MEIIELDILGKNGFQPTTIEVETERFARIRYRLYGVPQKEGLRMDLGKFDDDNLPLVLDHFDNISYEDARKEAMPQISEAIHRRIEELGGPQNLPQASRLYR